MPLEEKYLTVPHLKALTCNIEHESLHGHDNTFAYKKYFEKY